MAVVLLQLLFFIAKRHHIYFTTTYFLNTRLIYKNIYILRIHYIHMIAHIQVLCNDTRPHTCTCIPYIRNVCDVCDDLHVNVCDDLRKSVCVHCNKAHGLLFLLQVVFNLIIN